VTDVSQYLRRAQFLWRQRKNTTATAEEEAFPIVISITRCWHASRHFQDFRCGKHASRDLRISITKLGSPIPETRLQRRLLSSEQGFMRETAKWNREILVRRSQSRHKMCCSIFRLSLGIYLSQCDFLNRFEELHHHRTGRDCDHCRRCFVYSSWYEQKRTNYANCANDVRYQRKSGRIFRSLLPARKISVVNVNRT